MSTSKKNPATVRQGGPGSSHQNADAPLDIEKPDSDNVSRRQHSKVSGGGGERDSHHTHNPTTKGGHART